MPIDYRKYPKDWKQRRARALRRANYKCEHCGVENYSVIVRGEGKAYQKIGAHNSYESASLHRDIIRDGAHPKAIAVVLTLAHLDHDDWNQDVKDNRLAVLCQRCHFQYDRADNENREKYGKHYKKDLIPLL
jgi:hypothetical protein